MLTPVLRSAPHSAAIRNGLPSLENLFDASDRLLHLLKRRKKADNAAQFIGDGKMLLGQKLWNKLHRKSVRVLSRVEAQSTQDAQRDTKEMEPIDVNGSVHTAHKQHQRKNVLICMRVTSRVLCGLGLKLHETLFSCPRVILSGFCKNSLKP